MLPVMGSLTKANDGSQIFYAVFIDFARTLDKVLRMPSLRKL